MSTKKYDQAQQELEQAAKERQAADKPNPQCPDCGATLQVEPNGKLKHIKHAS